MRHIKIYETEVRHLRWAVEDELTASQNLAIRYDVKGQQVSWWNYRKLVWYWRNFQDMQELLSRLKQNRENDQPYKLWLCLDDWRIVSQGLKLIVQQQGKADELQVNRCLDILDKIENLTWEEE